MNKEVTSPMISLEFVKYSLSSISRYLSARLIITNIESDWKILFVRIQVLLLHSESMEYHALHNDKASREAY